MDVLLQPTEQTRSHRKAEVGAVVGALWRAVGLWRVDAGTERACSRVYDALWGLHSPPRRRRERPY